MNYVNVCFLQIGSKMTLLRDKNIFKKF